METLLVLFHFFFSMVDWLTYGPTNPLNFYVELRIREEAWMGKFALNSSVKLHQEAAEQENAKKEQLRSR